jgi:hypothetical protein
MCFRRIVLRAGSTRQIPGGGTPGGRREQEARWEAPSAYHSALSRAREAMLAAHAGIRIASHNPNTRTRFGASRRWPSPVRSAPRQDSRNRDTCAASFRVRAGIGHRGVRAQPRSMGPYRAPTPRCQHTRSVLPPKDVWRLLRDMGEKTRQFPPKRSGLSRLACGQTGRPSRTSRSDARRTPAHRAPKRGQRARSMRCRTAGTRVRAWWAGRTPAKAWRGIVARPCSRSQGPIVLPAVWAILGETLQRTHRRTTDEGEFL